MSSTTTVNFNYAEGEWGYSAKIADGTEHKSKETYPSLDAALQAAERDSKITKPFIGAVKEAEYQQNRKDALNPELDVEAPASVPMSTDVPTTPNPDLSNVEDDDS